jgi:hypothetical protein
MRLMADKSQCLVATGVTGLGFGGYLADSAAEAEVVAGACLTWVSTVKWPRLRR